MNLVIYPIHNANKALPSDINVVNIGFIPEYILNKKTAGFSNLFYEVKLFTGFW